MYRRVASNARTTDVSLKLSCTWIARRKVELVQGIDKIAEWAWR
jgi:hypothetical protein